ncbi:MAG: hypothetical protein MUO94_00200 [Thermoplasmata archaeon]|nr:hypothetical protein [Thermoplasmata archaeon]
MPTLRDHLTQILRSRDFEVEEREGYLYGHRPDVSISILVASDLILEDVEDFVKNVRALPGRKVVASLGKADESIQTYLQERGVHYWSREEIEHELGSLQLESLSPDGGGGLIDEVISDEVPQARMELSEQSIPIIVESTEEHAEKIVKPIVGLEDVKHLARHEINGYKFELELVPHYLFHFLLKLDDKNQRAGIVAVNALTGHVETWRWGFELVNSIDVPHSKREPKVEYDHATEVAKEVIAAEYKAHVEVVKDYGHSEIIERKKLEDDAIKIEPKGLVYLPVWCVEGKGGAMIVNSSSGKIISEHLHGHETPTG